MKCASPRLERFDVCSAAPGQNLATEGNVEPLAILPEMPANPGGVEAKLSERIGVLTMLTLRVVGEQLAHCKFRLGRQWLLEVRVELAYLTDRIAQLLEVVLSNNRIEADQAAAR